MTRYEKVYCPHSGIYLGCIWFDGGWRAENRAVREVAFQTVESAREWLALQVIRPAIAA